MPNLTSLLISLVKSISWLIDHAFYFVLIVVFVFGFVALFDHYFDMHPFDFFKKRGKNGKRKG